MEAMTILDFEFGNTSSEYDNFLSTCFGADPDIKISDLKNIYLPKDGKISVGVAVSGQLASLLLLKFGQFRTKRPAPKPLINNYDLDMLKIEILKTRYYDDDEKPQDHNDYFNKKYIFKYNDLE